MAAPVTKKTIKIKSIKHKDSVKAKSNVKVLTKNGKIIRKKTISGSLKNIIFGSLMGVFLLGSAGFIISANIIHSHNIDTYHMQKAKIEAYKAQIDDIAKNDSESKETSAKARNFATDAGIAVAKAQSDYAAINPSTQPDSFMKSYDEVKKYINPEGSKLTPWFGPVPSSVQYKWTFLSTYSFSDDKAQVVWVCSQSGDTNNIYAYATGTYNVNDGTFSNVKPYLTNMGSSQIDSKAYSGYYSFINDLVAGKNGKEKKGNK